MRYGCTALNEVSFFDMDYTRKICVLTQEDLIRAGCFDIGFAIEACENALMQYADGRVIFPDKVAVVFDEVSQNRINCLPAGLKESMVYGMKWVSVFPGNPRNYGLPNLSAVLLLSELNTGFPVAFMEGTMCSNLRTAAVGAVAAKYLSREDTQVIGFIGAGEQAKSHFLSLMHVRPDIKVCKVASRTEQTEAEFIRAMSRFYPSVEFISCKGCYEEAAKDAQIIVTAISGQERLLQAQWIAEGALYLHVGGLEDDYAVPRKAAKIVCDDWSVVKHRTQTISRMYKEGLLFDRDIYGDLYEIVSGRKQGRENDQEFIYFNSVGLSYVDVMLANCMYRRAKEKGLGSYVNMQQSSMFDVDICDVVL